MKRPGHLLFSFILILFGLVLVIWGVKDFTQLAGLISMIQGVALLATAIE